MADPAINSSRVETVSGWRKQAKAEEDSGLSTSRNTILLSDLLCDICTIGVGRDHYERELYLYPVHPGTRECIGDSRVTFREHRCLHICGGCAHKRHLSSHLCMLEERHFLTNALFCTEGDTPRALDLSSELDMLRLKKAIREHIRLFTEKHAAPLAHTKPKPARNAPPKRRTKRPPLQQEERIAL